MEHRKSCALCFVGVTAVCTMDSPSFSSEENQQDRFRIKELEQPTQGDADWRQYRCLKLPNGITVCCVHDPMSKTTAVATTVNVGAAHDPRTMSGLARKISVQGVL
jgi:predicted Zn-dependent peptidase